MRLFRGLWQQDGQALPLVGLWSAVLIGAAALVVDVGRGYVAQALAENATAAAALAGATYLPFDPTQALATAEAYGQENGLAQAHYQVACGGTCLVAQAQEAVATTLARILGVDHMGVMARAAAARAQDSIQAYTTPAPGTAVPARGYDFFASVPANFASLGSWGTTSAPTGLESSTQGGQGEGQGGGGSSGFEEDVGGFSLFAYHATDIGQGGLLPLGLTVDTLNWLWQTYGSPLYHPFTLKAGPQSSPFQGATKEDGNFAALVIDGPGASTYEWDMVNGASSTVYVGETLYTQTGNLAGPTDQAMAERQANYANGDPQLAVVPVIQAPSGLTGHCAVTVVGFAAVRLLGYSASSQGNPGAITAELVGAFLPGGTRQTPSIDTGVFGGSPFLLSPQTPTDPVVATLGAS